MKFIIISSLLVLSPIILIAQEDSTFLRRNEKNKKEIKDSLNNNLLTAPQLSPRTLIIKMKDLKEIKNLRENPFIVIDDTSSFSTDELASGLSEEELARYKNNKEAIKRLLKLSKTIGVMIILLLSIL